MASAAEKTTAADERQPAATACLALLTSQGDPCGYVLTTDIQCRTAS